jgi:hypothetical protein
MPRKLTPEDKNYYINKDEMTEQLRISQEQGHCSEELGRMFMLIANRYSTKYNFWQYTYRDEMVSRAIVRCLHKMKTFDLSRKTSPLCYFTMVIFNEFRQVLNKEKRQHLIRESFSDHVWETHCQNNGLKNEHQESE